MAISAQFTVNLYHFLLSHVLSLLQLFFYGLKGTFFRLSKRPYLLHSVQMAVTGDFLKKMSEISPPESPFRIFNFLVVFLLFRHVPPCSKVVT